MRTTRSFTLSFSLLALVVLVALSGQAFATTTDTVGLCAGPGTHYTTIQAAVNAPGITTVEVCPGTYAEQVTITKNLTLKGIANGTADAAVVVVPAGGLVTNGVTDIFGNPVAAQIFVQNAAVTISHITVDGTNNGLSGCSTDPIGIYYQNASGTITDSAVRNVLMDPADQGCQVGLAINVESNTGTPAVTISNNSVRNYDKNGITASGPGAGSPGPNVTVTGNTVIGLGATSVTAQNGIQIGFDATGSVSTNYVADDIYTGPTYGSSGILIYASSGVTVTSNTVDSTQLGIVPATDPTYGNANGTIIRLNHVGGTQTYDAIDLCSDGNTASSNVIYGSAESAVHVDDECPPSTGSHTTVSSNTINEACAGILIGPSSASNTIGTNTFMNVTNTTLAGDTCTPLAGPSGKHQSIKPSAYNPNR
ncbi:MAG: NosD domain-containing protein [Terriglobales bacterium]|jgi:copper-binding protein NosD